MMKNMGLINSGITLTVSIVTSMLFVCVLPEDPTANPENVTIEFTEPDTIYNGDPVSITVITGLPLLIDSIQINFGNTVDTVLTVIGDTMPVLCVFQDTGLNVFEVKAFCRRGVVKECSKNVRIRTNPFMPPQSVYTLSLSDTSVSLSWKSISTAQNYRVYRSLTDTGTFTPVEIVSDTFFIDGERNAATTYYYTVASLDSLGRESGFSSVCTVTTLSEPLSRWNEMVWDQNIWH